MRNLTSLYHTIIIQQENWLCQKKKTPSHEKDHWNTYSTLHPTKEIIVLSISVWPIPILSFKRLKTLMQFFPSLQSSFTWEGIKWYYEKLLKIQKVHQLTHGDLNYKLHWHWWSHRSDVQCEVYFGKEKAPCDALLEIKWNWWRDTLWPVCDQTLELVVQ